MSIGHFRRAFKFSKLMFASKSTTEKDLLDHLGNFTMEGGLQLTRRTTHLASQRPETLIQASTSTAARFEALETHLLVLLAVACGNLRGVRVREAVLLSRESEDCNEKNTNRTQHNQKRNTESHENRKDSSKDGIQP